MKIIVLLCLFLPVTLFAQKTLDLDLDIKFGYYRSTQPNIEISKSSASDKIIVTNNVSNGGFSASGIFNFRLNKLGGINLSIGLQYAKNSFDVVFDKSIGTDVSVVDKFIIESITDVNLPLSISKDWQIGSSKWSAGIGCGLTFTFISSDELKSSNASVSSLLNNFQLTGPISGKLLYKIQNKVDVFIEPKYSLNFIHKKGNVEGSTINEFSTQNIEINAGIRVSLFRF